MGNDSNPIPAMTNTHPPLERPVVMIGQQYLTTQYPVELIFPSKKLSSTGNIKDVNGTVIFKIESKSFPCRRFLTDVVGNILITLRKKKMSAHTRWEGFRGESTYEQDLLFSVKKTSMLGECTKLNVYLANNESEQVPDFKIRGSAWIERSCVVFLGDTDSKSIIGQMHRGHNYLQTELSLLDSDNFALTTYPNVDYAFITALAIVLDEMNHFLGNLEALENTHKVLGVAETILSDATG